MQSRIAEVISDCGKCETKIPRYLCAEINFHKDQNVEAHSISTEFTAVGLMYNEYYEIQVGYIVSSLKIWRENWIQR